MSYMHIYSQQNRLNVLLGDIEHKMILKLSAKPVWEG